MELSNRRIPTQSLMLSVREAATRLGVTPRRVQVLINEGRVQATRVGNAYVVTAIPAETYVRKSGRPANKP